MRKNSSESENEDLLEVIDLTDALGKKEEEDPYSNPQLERCEVQYSSSLRDQIQSLGYPTLPQKEEIQPYEKKIKKSAVRIKAPELIQYTEKSHKKITSSKYEFDEIFEILKKNPIQAFLVIDRIMKQPVSQEEKEENIELEKLMIEDLKQNDQYLPIMALRSYLRELGSDAIFTKKSSIKSRLSFMLLITNFASNQRIYLERFGQSEEFEYRDIAQNQDKMEKFIKAFKKRTAKKYKIKPEDIFVHYIYKGSIKVIWSTSQELAGQPPKLVLHKYFQMYNLSPDDFEPKHNEDYGEKKKIQDRGGIVYIQPRYAKKYGLKVKGKYENDQWLSMTTQNPLAWAVGFHGVWQPDKEYNNSKIKVLNNILKSLGMKEVLIPGPQQKRKGDSCANFPGKIPQGVYLTPLFQTALSYCKGVSVEGKQQKYYLIFQCRLKPSSIRMSGIRNDYWVVEHSHNIRPYGIIMVKESNKSKIKAKPQNGQEHDPGFTEFKWENYSGFCIVEFKDEK